MRFLVVGASGFVGRHLLAHLGNLGYLTVGTQSRPDPQGRLVHFQLLEHRLQDRLDRSFFETDEPRLGILCVASRSPDSYVTHGDSAWKINVDFTKLLIQDLCRLGIRPVFLSSNYVFDGTRGNLDEDAPCNPINHYGRAKCQIEAFLQAEVPQALVTRLDKVVGDDPGEQHLFTQWCQLMESGRPIECIAGQMLAPIWVNDVARAIVTSCQLGLQGVYHLAGPESYLRDELVRRFAGALGVDVKVMVKPLAAFGLLEKRPLRGHLDSSRFRQRSGMAFTSMSEVFRSFCQQWALRKVA